MKKLLVLLLMATIITTIFSFSKHVIKPVASQDKDSIAREREKYFKEVMAVIKDRKDLGCDSVFSNIKTFTGTQKVKAEHMLWIMSYWGEALGVSCTHCHNPANWASDEKQTKQIARDMYQLRVTVNEDILKNIKGLQSKTPRINCGTCHQGHILPKE
ncbi:MAG: c-type cytochrome [Sphingobacteriales bacterium]|nr:c-type cytochrome [Sphingobacteriales bacterium]